MRKKKNKKTVADTGYKKVDRKEKKKKEKQEEKRRQKKLSVQQSIAYKEMGRDGICRVQGKTYSKCIRFYDINYQLAQNEDKNAIFENWCDFLNYFDSSIHFQLSFINHKSSMKEFEQVIRIRPQEDAFDDVRMEYAKMLKQQLAKGNNGLVKSKYITFSIEADNIREAKPKLERIESDILNNFKILGVPAYPLNGVERLQILYETFNPDVMPDFQFDYDIIIGDPEGEYYPLVHALGGQVVHISPTSKDYINPMDINMDYSDDDNPLGVKSDFVLSLCELIMGSRDGIEAEEKSVIDRCLPLVYQKYFADPKPENMPVLGDLYDCLRKQKEPQAQRIATALEIYVNGSLKVFNHRTNVELNNRIVCFDIKELGKQLKKIGMLIVQDQVWNRVTINRGIKSTRYYIDEFHLLLKEEQTAAYSVEIWKRFRKWGGVPTGITQNIKDLLASREIENIFENSDFILMLNQAAGDRQILAKQLNISPYQLSYVTNSGEGEGLLFYGTTIIPFKDKFDKTLKLYGLMTTKPEETLKRDKEMRDANEGN